MDQLPQSDVTTAYIAVQVKHLTNGEPHEKNTHSTFSSIKYETRL